MAKLITSTLSDMRKGRETWRVISLFTAASFIISVATTLAQ